VIFLGYTGTSQMACLEHMGQKITVPQSSSGEMPESGWDVLNGREAERIEMAPARVPMAASNAKPL
jgi:hypothetical protein